MVDGGGGRSGGRGGGRGRGVGCCASAARSAAIPRSRTRRGARSLMFAHAFDAHKLLLISPRGSQSHHKFWRSTGLCLAL